VDYQKFILVFSQVLPLKDRQKGGRCRGSNLLTASSVLYYKSPPFFDSNDISTYSTVPKRRKKQPNKTNLREPDGLHSTFCLSSSSGL